MTGPITVREWDEIVVSGRASSPVHDFLDLHCTVATVDVSEDDDVGPAIKVWPEAGQPDPDESGKIWFPWRDVGKVEVVWRPED